VIRNPKEILKQFWGFSDFKGSQEKVIHAVLQRQDVLALLPTGGGKSLCYQIPGMAQEGICIVVSPLVALIQNQVDALRKKGIKAIALTGGIPFDEVNDLLDNCLYGQYKFLYLSPERLQQDLIKERILQMDVNLIAIDEAHCISQWGNDFRPAYLECAVLRDMLPQVPIIALTATATQLVATDIIEHLKLHLPLTVKDSFSRDNITFRVVWEEDKRGRLKKLCTTGNESSIVYVRSRRLAQETAAFLNQHHCAATFYHGGLTKKEKVEKLNLWLNNKVKVMVATNAFGMGIDKADVRLVVHYQIPDSIENYFQEAGRAGRDNHPAEAVLITNKTDEAQVKAQFLSVLPDVAFLKLLYNKLNNYFQIPYGEGFDSTFYFSFNHFCATYQLNAILAYNALRILDQNSVIALTDSFSKTSNIQFLASKQHLFQYLEHYKTIAPTIQTLLRTYGGIFEYETKINTLLVAKKANSTEELVIKTLEQLQKDGIIAYQSKQTDLEITFLVPREDDQTINVFAKKVKAQQQVKIDNIESMLGYIKNNTLCRSQQILAYFGEQKKECGKCDVCLGQPKVDKAVLGLIAQDILKLLQQKPQTSGEIIQHLPYKENAILTVIQHLLEDEIIEINSRNQYTLT
jgi:ATP-dependent DNA helicase RecQ